MELTDQSLNTRLLDLSQIDGRIAEILHLIDYIPEDMAEYQEEIKRFDGFIRKYNNRKHKVALKVEECERLLNIEQERLAKAEKLLKINKEQSTYIATKKFETLTLKVIKQLQTVIEAHQKSTASVDEALKEMEAQKEVIAHKFEEGQQSLKLGHNNLKDDLAELRQQEKELRLTVDKEFLHMFDPISSRNIRPVVVKVENTRCPACSGEFPDRQLQEMYAGIVHKCQSCQRLMVAFIPENVEQPATSDK